MWDLSRAQMSFCYLSFEDMRWEGDAFLGMWREKVRTLKISLGEYVKAGRVEGGDLD